ncbi:hypothetical protein RIR_jg16836.t1 [Rhizophagus irregularis DAOM 181602=DAOM 197198]|nr:hypothetical protein RIR_jg16836.t1 [Rhizophagus irregularis DAOM 181602=DAOM 197198]
MTSVTLNFLVVGEDPYEKTLPVDIDINKNIGALKKTIKNDIGESVSVRDLKLFRVDIPLGSTRDEDVIARLKTGEFSVSLEMNNNLQKISDHFSTQPANTNLHILVQLPIVAIGASVSMGSSSKRNYEEEQNINVKKIRHYPSLSSFAQIDNLYKSQQKNTQDILIHRPSSYVSMPLILYDPVFFKFKSDFNNEGLIIDKEHNQWTLECINTMAKFYLNEKLRQKEFHELICKLLAKDVKVLVLDDKSSNDGTLELDFHSYSILYLLIKIKNEIGTGKCDPTTQAAASYAKFYTQEKNQKLLKVCNLPCFIIGLAGPWICILGAVYVEKPLVEPLTSFEPLIFTNDRIHLNKIARLFKALSLGCERLKKYYNALPSFVLNTVDHQRFFPFIRKFHEINFDYKEKLFDNPHKLLWKAETQGEDRLTIVIKFTHSYNKKAHELCHSIGKAPRLLCVSSAHTMHMIIMEYVDGQKLCDCCDLKGSEYKRIIKDIEEAVDLLHKNGIVFADLRDSNILVIKNEDEYHGMLVDFDWAGEDNKDLYPAFMNADINWPTGAEDNKVLKKEHDIYWLDVLKRKYLNEVKEMPTTEVKKILITEVKEMSTCY